MKHRSKFGLTVLGILLFTFLLLNPSNVEAGGGGSYPNGVESFMVGAAPPPGFYLKNYVYYYHASDMKDDHGNNIDVFDDLTVWAEVLRFIWISEKKILGGNYGQHVFLPLLDVSLDFKAPLGPKGKKRYDDTDVPYIIWSPFILAHHFLKGKLHTVLSLPDIYIPTGYDKGDLAGVSHNFWTFEPVFAVTYMPTPTWEFSAKFMYDFNTKQDDCPTVYGFNVDRTPGDEFHFDYSLSYGFSKSFRVGLSGYYYKQVSNDDYDIDSSIPAPVRDLLKADEGNHSEVFAIGPGLWYNYKNMFFTLRTQFEMDAKNKTEGQNVIFNFVYAF
ncbi:MAG: transporter [Pseudomonadota bacterium]|nr:transporter [Pseudomonadota bacterium]